MNNANLRQLLGIALLLALVASCGKKSSDTEEPVTPPAADSATVRYQVTSSNRSSGLVNWTTVKGAGKQVAFKGNGTTRIEVYKFNFMPSSFDSPAFELITVRVPAGTYTDAEFNYQMIPSRDPALQLIGTYTTGGVSTPVRVNIDQFAEIATKLPSVTLAGGKTYNALITLDLAAIMNGVTAANLNNAARTNGEIVIAYYSNVSMLQTIINNINNVVHHQVTLGE
ncbi:hypothetical protein EPD60_02530 [Flaviaesturariibacter flavus]|uniref:Uncharacterized protein n=1 Tax=Flaviaesturariibacter flavus TaxID=2502780 RepID=A0A4R1BP15_9BACT|nr:hypothetical protein [Flaviaesturariibacter flavus]TCJ19314.1 hypothetical protein EPD60_02530 [Flaviaesturariibacter flavus]